MQHQANNKKSVKVDLIKINCYSQLHRLWLMSQILSVVLCSVHALRVVVVTPPFPSCAGEKLQDHLTFWYRLFQVVLETSY